MKQEKKKLWVPKEDFRTRFAQRDLEISISEYNRIRDQYLASQRKKREQEEKIREEIEKQEAIEKERKLQQQKQAEDTLKQSEPAGQPKQRQKKVDQQKTAVSDIKIPSIQEIADSNRASINSFLNRKITSRRADAPQEKKEQYLDISVPSITGLMDDYTKPVVYNTTSGMFQVINDPEETISSARQALLNRPTPEGLSDYESRYLQATDPVQRLNDVRNRYNVPRDPVDIREEQEAKGTFWENIASNLMTPGYGAGQGNVYATQPLNNIISNNINSNIKTQYNIADKKDKQYIDDIISTWSVGKNNAEFDAYVDSAVRLGEKKQYANIIKQYSDNIDQYIQLQQQFNESIEDPNVSDEEKRQMVVQMNNILAQNEKLRPKVEEAASYKYSPTVGGTVFKSIRDFFFNILDGGDYGKQFKKKHNLPVISDIIPDDVGNYGQQLLDLAKSYKLTPGRNINEQFLAQFENLKNNINSTNDKFQSDVDEEIKKDRELALRNKQEALDWLEWHTPSAEFKAKEKAAQANYLTDFDTYKYGMWGVLGSSASFNGIQLLSTGLNWLGAGLLMAPHPGAKAAGAVSTAAGAGLGIVSGVYENRAEVTQNYISGLRNSLQERGLLKKFLEDGKKQLEHKGIVVRDDEDVFRHFILKDYKPNNPVIQDLALRHMFGANNVFQNDMMAVSADVAFNAGLNVFGATGKVAEAMKLLPQGSKYAILRKVAENDLGSAAYHATAKMAKPNMLASALSPLANIPYNVAVKPIVTSISGAMKPMIKQAATYMARAAEWARIAPKGMFNTSTVGKYAFNFLGKQLARGFSEAIEEGKQYEYGKMFSEGKFAGKSNSIFSTLIDDLSTGLYTGTAFIGSQFLGIEPDKELMSNMRGGFLGGVLNSGAFITATQNTINAVGELRAGDVFFNNIMAEKLRQRSNIINGEEMAKYASRSGYVNMMNAIDRAERIHQHISESASDKVGLSEEEIENQRNQFKRIAAIANSIEAKNRAKKLGIKEGSDRFRSMVSLMNYADQMQMENINLFNDLVDQAQQILEKDGMSLDVTKLFEQAWNSAYTDEQKELINKAAEFAEWAQPLNNQIVGQYNALNNLISELESRSEFLTRAERRNLNHYKAQREKLDSIVEDIKSKIGGTENMQFMNNVPQDILDKYTSIYRTLYQASAQLETSTLVLDNLWGKNDAKVHANDYVADQLDFINGRINELNKEKDKAVKSSKKSARDRAALEFIEQYEKSVQDDIELMAEIADRFDKEQDDRNKGLYGAVEEEQEESEEPGLPGPVVNEEQQQQPEDRSVQGLPTDTTQLALPVISQFPVGSTIESINEPGNVFTIRDIKINPSTGQFLIEAQDQKGNTVTIEDTEADQYQKALPAPYHFEKVFEKQKQDSWLRFKKNSPFAQAFEAAKNALLPAVIDDSFVEQARVLFKARIPKGWDVDSSQYDMMENLMTVDSVYSNKMVEWNPIYGCIYKNNNGQYFYVPSFTKLTPSIYPDFKARRDAKLKIVKQISDLRDSNMLEEIAKLLEDHNINAEYINVINDNAALMSIAEQISEFDNPSTKEWLANRARYTDLEYLLNSPEGQRIFGSGTVVLTNIQTSIANQSAFIDAISIDEDGRVNIYIMAFPSKMWTDEDLDNKGNHQESTRREYYTQVANDLFATLDPHIQLAVKGVYVLPINQMGTGTPIQLSITTPINNNTGLQQRALNYANSLDTELAYYISRQEQKSRPRPATEGDGSPELTLQEILESLEQFEQAINDVYSGKLSFNGKIRADVRQFLDNDKNVLNKYRNFLRRQEQTQDIKDSINRIETIWQQIVNILSAYKTTDVYNPEDFVYEGETVDSHRPIIPDNHPLAALSTSGIPVTASSDFITNGKAELMYGWYNPTTKEFVKLNGYSTHPGSGVYVVFTYNGVKYDPIMVQPAHYKAGIQAYTEKGAQFVTDVIQMQNTSEGLPIIVTARRLIPNPRYYGPTKPLLEIPSLRMTEDDIQDITGDSDNVGIANSNNNVQLINKGEDKSILWKFKSTQAGSIFLLHTFNFAEYPDGGQIPVKLIPAKLDKSDIDVIIDILKQNASGIATGFRGTLTSRYHTKDGKESPITNEDILRMLTTYDNRPSDRSLFYVDDYGRVFFRQRQSDKMPQPIDILTASGEQTLRSLLSNGYEVAQNRDVLSAQLGNQMDQMFSGLKKWIKENGSLVISKNLVFDEQDVDRNGRGFSGIGWSIRHGRLLSNLSGIYEPSISLSDPRIDNGTSTAQVEQSSEESTETREERIRDPFASGLLNNQFEFGVDWYATEELPEETLTEEEAREDIASILGDAAVEFVEDIICILDNGLKALGATLDNVIILSKLAGAGTQFHEAFHKIIELLIDDKTRQRIYKAFSNLHPEVDPNNARQITEGLAEDFKAYARKEKSSSKWSRFWRHIWKFITTMLNADKRVLYKMYRDAYRGKYKNIKPSQENIDRFNRIFDISKEERGVLYHTIYDASTGENINLPNVPSDVDYRDAINTIVDYIVSESGAGLFGEKVTKIQFTKERVQKLGKDGSVYKKLIGGKNPDDINKIFIDIFDNWDHVLGDVVLSLKRFGLHFRHNKGTNEIETFKTTLSDIEETAKNEADESKAKSADINQYELADYEISKIQKMSERTKYFFATIPDIRFVEEFDEEPMYVVEKNVYGEQIDAKGRVIKTDPETGARYIETKEGEVIHVPSKDGQPISTAQVPINMVRNTKPVYNKFGFPQFAPFHNTCKVALNRCYSANSLEELLQLFIDASTEFPVFVTIAQRFASLLNNIKLRGKKGTYITTDGKEYRRLNNGLFQEVIGKDKYGEEYYTVDELDFKKNRNNQAMAVSIFNNISGTRLHFFNIMSTRPSPNSIVFQRMDTEGGYSARKYTQAWHALFINDTNKVRPAEVMRHGEQIVIYTATNKNLFKDVANELKLIVDSYTDRRSAGWRTGEIKLGGKVVYVNRDPEAVKAYYLKLLNTIGITVTAKEFNHLLFELFGKTDIHALRKYFQQDGEDFGRTKGVSIRKLILAIEQGIQENGEYARTVVSGSFYSAIGAITQLADGIWSYRQTTKDLMTRAPGKNRYYQVANRNAQDVFMQDLNTPDSKMLRDFFSSPYHRGSIMIDALMRGDVYLRSNTNAGYVSDNKSDFGQDFMSITDPEDAISKMTLLIEGDITPPTLSNKKTYQPVQIIDRKTEQQIQLPGIYYIANRNNAQTADGTAEVYSATNVPILVDKPWVKRAQGDYSLEGKEFVVSDQVYNTLIKYAFSEYYQIKQNVERMKTIPEGEKVVNYDTATKGAKIPGALRFSRFYEVYVREEVDGKQRWTTVNFNDNNAESYEDNLRRAEEVFFGNDITYEMRKAMLTEIINRRLEENLEYLVTQGILKHRSKNWKSQPVYSRYEPVVIDTAHLNAIQKQYGQKMSDLYGNAAMRSVATCAFVLDIMLKHQIGLEEYQRLFVGNPGLFVTLFNEDGSVKDDTGDLSKRLGGHMSTGETQCRLDDVPDEYTVAELKDFKTTSSQITELKDWFEESESRFVLYADKQKSISIQIQKLRSNLQAIAFDIFKKAYNADGILSTYEDVFKPIEDEWAEKFASGLEAISKSESMVAYSIAMKNLLGIIDSYKTSVVSAEYKRQRQLSLQQVKGELEERKLLTGVNTRIAAYTSNFVSKINVADGASFVSPIMVKYMLMKIGKFTGKVERAWESLQKGNVLDPLKSAVLYKEITDALFGTQKYTATGYRMNNGQPITYYTKSAFFPLFRQNAHGKTKDILDKMEQDNVMMLCFESAKKFGSQGKQDFPTTPEELSSFHFNVYKEDFKYLRKQLNTDPKEENLQSVGSQTKKIALTILDVYKDDYVKRDGTTETGQQLKQRIFDCERSLASIGFLDLMDRFSSVEEKAKYLRDNLGERDADSNMLQGLSLVLDPETRQKRMRAHLEALSNSGWIQSIITSLANKHIVDINLPGSAYIQRSVYAMEDNNILGDNQVYGIPKLHISNDWSSMDAVVSIDYFYQFFPQLEDMSFEDARQWLIDHNVIGENAKAETVAYRIPTQANSSIHALRFIDVISTVRDTIILPEEFTAITGSDFDIDKLFLSTKFYSFDEETDVVNTEFDKLKDPMKHFGNELLECYLELLTQDKSKYANQLVRSIDYDTSIPMQVVNLLKEGKVDKVTVYQALQLWKQCQIKALNRTGGISVGPYALNNNNEIMTSLFEVESDNVGLIQALDISRLYDKLDAEGNSVMATIGAFITGSVDIAKDPWIGVLNINEYTYDIHIYLARAGMGLRALWFCSQPIMRKAAEVYMRAGGYLFDKKNESVWVRRNRAFTQLEDEYLLDDDGKNGKEAESTKLLKAVKAYRNRYDALGGSKAKDALNHRVTNAVYAIQQIFGVSPEDPSIKIDSFKDNNGFDHEGTILQDIALFHNREEDIFDPEERYTIKQKVITEDGEIIDKDIKISVKDVQFYVYLANIMIDDPVSDMKNLVQYSKIETKKQGKNRAEQLAYNHKYDSFFSRGNTKIMLPETVQRMVQDSSIDTKQNLFTTAVEQILGKEMLSYTPAYKYFTEEFSSVAVLPFTKDVMKSIIDGVSSYQKWEYIEQYAELNGISIRDLFVGSKSIYNELMRIKQLIIDYPAVYKNYTDGNGDITNALLESLQPSDIPGYIMQDYGKTLPKFVDFGAIQENESNSNNDIIAGWAQMLHDEEHKDLQYFAKRLIVYSFITSGDTNKPGSFFNLVPFSWREDESKNRLDQSYVQYIDQLINDSQEGDDEGKFRISDRLKNEGIYELILRNNWFDDNLVPTIQETSKDDMGNTVSNYFQYTVAGEPILISLVKTTIDGNGMRRFHEATLDKPKLIIKLHNYDAHSYNNPQDFKLYRFVRMGTVFDADGEPISFPIYGRISQIGGVMYGHHIITYRDDLDMSWERDTKWYTDNLDAKMVEGIAQIKDQFEIELRKNEDQIAKGVVTKEELKLETAKNMVEQPIMGSYEDGTPIGYTRSNATQFYEMVKSMSMYHVLYDRKNVKYDHNDSLRSIKKPEPIKDSSRYTLHSGGAPGSDTYWGEIATQYGIGSQRHYYHGEQSPSNAPNANTRITEVDYDEGKKEAAAAAKYNWGYQYDSMKDDRLVRNWSQVKYADGIFAIGHIANPGDPVFPNQPNDTRKAIHPCVQGGTGYAVGMAILHQKPVYVFDQEENQWFAWDGSQFNPIDTPTLTLNFAGIGTRQINEVGKQAIRDVFEKTFKTVVETKSVEQKKIDIWSTNHDKYANLSNVAIRSIDITPSIVSVVNEHFPQKESAKALDKLDNVTESRMINRILRLAPEGFDKFNSVEQLFQLIKFEAMKQFIRESAKDLYGLSGVDIAKGSTETAAAIKSVLDGIKDKQDRIFKSTGSKITSISHEMIPDIDGIRDAFFNEKWNQGGPDNVLNSTAYAIIREIMLQSFLQNTGAAKLLLSTEDSELTHEKGGLYWKTGFPAALMSVRAEIAENYNTIKDIESRALTLLGGDEMAYKEYTTAIKAGKEGKMFSDVEPFFTPEEVEQIKQAIPNMKFMGNDGKLIVTSASRHTDPVFYATEVINILRENSTKPFTDPTRINVIELWSKHDGIPMQNILEACKKYRVAPMVSFSITTLGNTVFEPGVMKADDLLDNIEKLINIGILDPRVTTFRIDPILVGVTSVQQLKHVIERGANMGIRKFVTSPVQSYASMPNRSVIPYVDKALKSDSDSFIKYPDAVTQTGEYNWMKYYGKDKHRPQYIAFTPKAEYVKPYIDMFQEMMSKYGISIQSCAVPMAGLTPSACLDPEIIEAITSLKTDAVEDATRKFCKCYGVHSDVFRYNDECKSSCVYCYAGQMKTDPFDYYDEYGKLKDFAYSKVNEYSEIEDGPVKVVIRNDEYTLNGRDVVDANGQPVDADTKNRVIWKRAVDINKANLVKVGGIYYVVTNTGIIFNWGTAKVENFGKYDTLKKTILRAAQVQYDKPVVSTVFNAAELKQLGESRKKFCKV